MKRRSLLIAGGSGVGHLAFLGGCAVPAARPATSARGDAADLALLNRVTWGIDSAAMAEWGRLSRRDYLQAQLHPAANARLPAGAQAQIDALSLFQKTMPAWVVDMEQRRRDADALANDDARKTAQQAYQQDLNRLARDAATQTLLRALYSPDQLQEQLTWFWFNHFNVHQYKSNLRVMVGPPSTVLNWLGGKPVNLAKPIAKAPAVVDGHGMEAYLRATSYYSENPANFPHLMQCAAAGMGALS